MLSCVGSNLRSQPAQSNVQNLEILSLIDISQNFKLKSNEATTYQALSFY